MDSLIRGFVVLLILSETIMLNDIQHILKTLKKGIVVVENGKPSYVVVPFEEFERVSGDGRRGLQASPMDDTGLIQKMIEQDLATSQSHAHSVGPTENSDEIKAVLDALDRENEERADAPGSPEILTETPADEHEPKKVNLEDLPF